MSRVTVLDIMLLARVVAWFSPDSRPSSCLESFSPLLWGMDSEWGCEWIKMDRSGAADRCRQESGIVGEENSQLAKMRRRDDMLSKRRDVTGYKGPAVFHCPSVIRGPWVDKRNKEDTRRRFPSAHHSRPRARNVPAVFTSEQASVTSGANQDPRQSLLLDRSIGHGLKHRLSTGKSLRIAWQRLLTACTRRSRPRCSIRLR